MRISLTIFFVSIFVLSFSQDSCFLQKVYDPEEDAGNFKAHFQKVDEYVNSFKGCTAPSFEAQTLDGKKISSNDLKGKVVVLNFWFTKCHPCVGEFPSLNRLAKEFSDKGVVFISFALDTAKVLDSFLRTRPLLYQVVPSAQKIADVFKISPYPTNIILDRNFKVAEIIHGGNVDPEHALDNYKKLAPIIEAELKKKITR